LLDVKPSGNDEMTVV